MANLMKSKFKGIVFDLDGTLVDSLSATFEAFNHGITQAGMRPHTPAEIMKYFGPGELEIFSAIIGPEKAEAAYATYRAHLSHHIGRVPLHAGVGEMLDDLKARNLPIAIFTGRSWNTTEVILRHHGILDRFVTVIANDHVSAPKPSPEGLKLALSRMKLTPTDALFVGDMAVDMQAARAAGAPSAAALWDVTARREQLAQHQPHYWVNSPRELCELL
jgi:HAD superfamily hydrolase (TIGR01509 family)